MLAEVADFDSGSLAGTASVLVLVLESSTRPSWNMVRAALMRDLEPSALSTAADVDFGVGLVTGASRSSSSSSKTDFLAVAFAGGFTISSSSSNTDFLGAGFSFVSADSTTALLDLAAGLLEASNDIKSSSPASSSKILFLTVAGFAVAGFAGAGFVAVVALGLEGNGALKMSLSSSSNKDLAADFLGAESKRDGPSSPSSNIEVRFLVSDLAISLGLAPPIGIFGMTDTPPNGLADLAGDVSSSAAVAADEGGAEVSAKMDDASAA